MITRPTGRSAATMRRVWQLIWAAGLLASAIQSGQPEVVHELLDGVGKLIGAPGWRAPPANGARAQNSQAKCLFEREPEFRTPPRLFFYAHKQHSASTLGCQAKKATWISLRKRKGQGPMESKLDSANIRRRLIDSKLFEPSLNTYFIVHGFQASWNSSGWVCNLKDLLLNRSEANVFLLDWSGGARPQLSIDYGLAVSNTQVAGALLGEFIEQLVQLSGQRDATSHHLIGHSLGAHVAGFAGYRVKSLGKITALDPAGPCFRTRDAREAARARDTGHMRQGRRRLSRQSANLVLAVHTDSRLFGLPEQCAHYDVFINGGFQPFCHPASIPETIGGLLLPAGHTDGGLLSPSCPHSFAYELLGSLVLFVRQIGAQLEQRKEEEAADEEEKGLQKGGGGGSGGSTRADQRDAERESIDNRNDQCHLISYQCASYEAFEQGQCGLCKDADSSCVFVGLNFDHERGPIDLLGQAPARVAQDADQPPDDNDHHQQEPKPAGGSRGAAFEWDSEWEERARAPPGSQGELFVKTGPVGDVCLFHYQLLVALDGPQLKRVRREHLHPLRLQLEPEHGAKRPIELPLKHRLERGAAAFERLRDDFIDSLWEADARVALDSRDNLTFYTALLTFNVAPGDKCASSRAVAVGARLCRPFHRLAGARLWSTDAGKLAAVRWAALNYMSGLDERARASRSFVLEPALEAHIQAPERRQADRKLTRGLQGDRSELGFALELAATRLDRRTWQAEQEHAARDGDGRERNKL